MSVGDPTSRVLKHPCVRQIADLGDEGKVVPAESCGFGPVIAVLEEADNGDGVPLPSTRLVFPDTSLDQAETNDVGWCL